MTGRDVRVTVRVTVRGGPSIAGASDAAVAALCARLTTPDLTPPPTLPRADDPAGLVAALVTLAEAPLETPEAVRGALEAFVPVLRAAGLSSRADHTVRNLANDIAALQAVQRLVAPHAPLPPALGIAALVRSPIVVGPLRRYLVDAPAAADAIGAWAIARFPTDPRVPPGAWMEAIRLVHSVGRLTTTTIPAATAFVCLAAAACTAAEHGAPLPIDVVTAWRAAALHVSDPPADALIALLNGPIPQHGPSRYELALRPHAPLGYIRRVCQSVGVPIPELVALLARPDVRRDRPIRDVCIEMRQAAPEQSDRADMRRANIAAWLLVDAVDPTELQDLVDEVCGRRGQPAAAPVLAAALQAMASPVATALPRTFVRDLLAWPDATVRRAALHVLALRDTVATIDAADVTPVAHAARR